MLSPLAREVSVLFSTVPSTVTEAPTSVVANSRVVFFLLSHLTVALPSVVPNSHEAFATPFAETVPAVAPPVDSQPLSSPLKLNLYSLISIVRPDGNLAVPSSPQVI